MKSIATSLQQYAEKQQAVRQHRGLSLTETLLVLGVIALVAVIAYAGYNAATSSVKTGGETRSAVTLLNNIQKTFGTAANYNAVTVPNLINAGQVPSTYRVTGTTAINNTYGSPVYVGFAGSQYGIAVTGVPNEQCVEFAQGVASSAQEVYIAANVTAAPATPWAAATKPAAGAAKTLVAPTFAHATAITACSGTGATKTIYIFNS